MTPGTPASLCSGRQRGLAHTCIAAPEEWAPLGTGTCPPGRPWCCHEKRAPTYQPKEARGEGDGPAASRTRTTGCGGCCIAPNLLGTRSMERVLWGKSHCRTRRNKKPGQVRTRWNHEQGSEGLQTPRRSEDQAQKGRGRVRSHRSARAEAEAEPGFSVSCRLSHSAQDPRAHVW